MEGLLAIHDDVYNFVDTIELYAIGQIVFRLLYNVARSQGHSIPRSLGYAKFDLRLPESPSLVEPKQIPIAPDDSRGLIGERVDAT